MSLDLPLHALILTLNEEIHIGRAIASLAGIATSVLVVDSGSTDRTCEIAADAGARVVTNPWINYATQANFAIDALAGEVGWLFRLDADEVLEPGSAEGLRAYLAGQPDVVSGVAVRRRMVFMGRRIRHGGMEPSWQLRIWRNGRGRCEQRWMDEHVRVDGMVVRSPFAISDVNLKPVTWWVDKHNTYASREAIDILGKEHGFDVDGVVAAGESTSPGAVLKRAVKTQFYNRLPGGLRATLYFLMRYGPLLGFLDGRQGFYYHAMQAFWYRTLVDAKVDEIRAHAAAHEVTIPAAIIACTGIDPAMAPAVMRDKLGNL